MEAVPPLLTGQDLIDMGLRPGPLFSEILTAAFDAQLGGEIATGDEARAWALKRFGEHFSKSEGDDHGT